MARPSSRTVRCDPEPEAPIGEATPISLSARTWLGVIAIIISVTGGGCAIYFNTRAEIVETRSQTAALRQLVEAYIVDSNAKWQQYAVDRERDRNDTKEWRMELKDAIARIKGS